MRLALEADHASIVASDGNGGRAWPAGFAMAMVAWPMTLVALLKQVGGGGVFSRMLDVYKEGIAVRGLTQAGDFGSLWPNEKSSEPMLI